MGTRINVLMDHNIADYKDQSAVLAPLTSALPATLAVRDYWDVNDPSPKRVVQTEWTADLVTPYGPNFRSFTAPGSLFFDIGPAAAKIRMGGRWRGFVSIPPLYQVHLQAFRAVAHASGASYFACFPDCEDAWEAFVEGGTDREIIPILEHYFGPSHSFPDALLPEESEEAEKDVAYVWYYEKSEEPIYDKRFSQLA